MIIALIPARSGSKRVKDKNIRNLGGWPLMRWTVEVAKQSELFERIIVSSDSEVYLQMARGWGVEGISRPPELAKDDSGDWDVINHAMLTCAFEPRQVLIAYLRPTTPFRTTTLMQKAIQTLIDAKENATGLRSVEKMGESAWKCFEMNYGYLHPVVAYRDFHLSLWEARRTSNLPNHLMEKTYRGNGYIDIIKPEQILKDNLWGDRCLGFVTPRVIEIDNEEDLWFAEYLLDRKKQYEFGLESKLKEIIQ